MATFEIDREPLCDAVEEAMKELDDYFEKKGISSITWNEDDYYLETYIPYVGMHVIYCLNGRDYEPMWPDEDIHEAGKNPALLEDYLYDELAGAVCGDLRSDPGWRAIVSGVTEAFTSAYLKMFPAVV